MIVGSTADGAKGMSTDAADFVVSDASAPTLAGVLGALLAIPTAASLGVVIDELVLSRPPGSPSPEPETAE
ncbi:MAG TPA: hypothetical protein VFT14_05515 [Solirubrobacterales bacterium]|nr:hypothetical protein [Solirubrobacterales bacterium]